MTSSTKVISEKEEKCSLLSISDRIVGSTSIRVNRELQRTPMYSYIPNRITVTLLFFM